MNREIKFRVWDGTSFYFASASDLLDGYPSEHKCLNNELYFQQYTGLKDKNGKEIYEGDILRFYKNKPYQADYEVYWEKHGFSLISAKRDGDDFGIYTKNLHSFKGDEPEIVGNIFESPELLSPERAAILKKFFYENEFSSQDFLERKKDRLYSATDVTI